MKTEDKHDCEDNNCNCFLDTTIHCDCCDEGVCDCEDCLICEKSTEEELENK